MLPFHHLHKKTHHKHLRIKLTHRQHILVDSFAFAAGIVGPAMTIPELYAVFVTHNASGISLVTWGGFSILSLIWLTYGAVHKQKAILLSSILGFVMNALVVVGALYPAL